MGREAFTSGNRNTDPRGTGLSRAAPARASSAAGVATPGTGASFVEFMMQFFPRKRTVLCVLADKSPELLTGEGGDCPSSRWLCHGPAAARRGVEPSCWCRVGPGVPGAQQGQHSLGWGGRSGNKALLSHSPHVLNPADAGGGRCCRAGTSFGGPQPHPKMGFWGS